MPSWHELYSNFEWKVPATFNFATDVIDRFAADRSRVALYWEDESGRSQRWTFWDFSTASKRLAAALAALGVKRGDPVMVMLPRIPQWQVSILAALRLGAVVIPCTVSLRPKDIAYRASHSGARAIITIAEQIDAVESVRAGCPELAVCISAAGETPGWHSLDALIDSGSTRADFGAPTRSDDAALVFYTSGTTKEPKAVLHAHSYTFAHRYTGEYWLDLRREDLHWTTSDTGWAKAAYGVLFGPWSCGTPVLMYNGRFEPEKEMRLLERYEVSVFCAPPTEYRMLVKEDLSRFPLPHLRHCVGAGEPLNPEVIHAWKEAYGVTVHDGYGQTESILLVANLPGMQIKPGAMGKPFPGHDVRVIDPSPLLTKEGARGRSPELAAGEVGDLAVRGRPPSLFREYWKNPEESAGCVRGEWYLTGDRAYRDDDGYLWFVGRADDVIISAGYRIGPFEVESALLEHPAVLESAVVAKPHAVRGSIVKAFVCLRPGVDGNESLVRELQDHVKRVTAPYKYPREIEFVTELPKTVSGKIRRVELRDREARR